MRRTLLVGSLLPLLLTACDGGAPAGSGGTAAGELEAPGALDFGVVSLGEAAVRTLALRNVGPGPLVVEGMEVAPPFAVAPAVAGTVAPGETLDVAVTFSPETSGAVTGTARLRAGGQTREVRLAGAGGESPLRCEPETIDLGRPVAGAGRAFTVGCTNDSDRELAVETRRPDGTVSVAAEPLLVPAGERVSLDFVYRPTGLAPLDASLLVVSGAATLASVRVTAAPIATAVEWPNALPCPGGLDVGFAAPGTTTSRAFSFRNLGDAPVDVTASVLEGPFAIAPAPPFAVPPDDPATAEDEGTVEVTVTFAPTTAGPVAGQLHLAFDDPGTPEAGGCLTAFGGGPVPVCDPPALDFGAVASGAPRTATVTCRNDGTDVPGTDADRLHLLAAVSGTGFSVRTLPPAEGLGPGQVTTFDVTFGPTVAGPTSGVLAITTDVPATPRFDLPLAGDGYLLPPCAYRLEPPALAFGPVATGGTPATLAVSIANEGDEPCLLRDVRLAAGTSPAFSLPDGPVDLRLLAPGETLAVPVRFAPTAGEAAGSLALWIAAPDAPDAVPLSGSTAAAEPCLRIYPESVDFGDVAPGCASLEAELSVLNTCPDPVTLTGVAWVGPSPAFRLVAPAAGTLVPDGLVVPVRIQYTPAGPGDHFGGLRVTSAAGADTRLVPVHGRATAPSGVERFEAEPGKVDVLLVMFDSIGNGSNQWSAIHSVPSFLSVLAASDVDWQFGVTTTGVGDQLPCYRGGFGRDGRLVPLDGSGPRIVGPAVPDALQVAAANAVVGECQSDERGMEAAYLAVSPPVIDHTDDPRHPEANDGNRGFLRPDARLAVVVVGSEWDWSGLPQYFVALTGGAKRQVWREDRFVGHAVTGDPGRGCSLAGTSSAPADDPLVAWSAATGGRFVSICSPTLPAKFGELATAVLVRSRLLLKGRPSGWPSPTTSDLRIFVDGLPWQAPSSGWRWDATANAVVFDPAWAPAATETVEVRYSPRCVAPTE